MSPVQYLALMVPAAMLLIGSLSLWGIDTAAATAADSLVVSSHTEVAAQTPAIKTPAVAMPVVE